MRLVALAGSVVAALLMTAAAAYGAPTRAEYVAQVDPICQAGQAQEFAAVQPLLRATKRAKKHHKLRNPKIEKRLASRFSQYFSQYAAIEHQVNNQIGAVPPAPDDVSLIQVWLRARGELLDLESQLFGETMGPKGGGLKGLAKFFALIFELSGRQFEVTDMVRDFGFRYCSQEQEVAVGVSNAVSRSVVRRRSEG